MYEEEVKTDSDTKEDKKDALTVSRVDGDFRTAYQAKSKLVEREKEDFLYALGEQWSEEESTTRKGEDQACDGQPRNCA